jgi:hypothetical protein
LLELQIDKGFNIELRYKHTELNNSEEHELISIINNTNQYYSPQTISVDAMSYNMLMVAKNKNSTED